MGQQIIEMLCRLESPNPSIADEDVVFLVAHTNTGGLFR